KEIVEDSITNDSFIWPVSGTVVAFFGARVDKVRNKGIDIRASIGNKVMASRSVKVVFCDDRFKGYGRTVILDHGDSYQTVYAYNSEILVKVGDSVDRGRTIARVGSTGRAKEPSLHFEIRKDGVPQNPFYYLPR
ncbi:MAG: M23 family metallopeptidase, partial [Candidatus Omnitrophica bacterium]|nr:M23 family metallopeptidase [Candidatus Omnitrophota bacterium]